VTALDPAAHSGDVFAKRSGGSPGDVRCLAMPTSHLSRLSLIQKLPAGA
jgi:hypothetical protein